MSDSNQGTSADGTYIKEVINLRLENDGLEARGGEDFSSVVAQPGRGVGALRSPTPLPLHPIKMDEVKVVPPPVLELENKIIKKEIRDIREIGEEKRKAKDKQKWKTLEIRPRDIRLLTLILHQKFLTLDQIQRACFADVSLQMARMRLRKLMHFGMIKARRVYTEARQIYLLERPGYKHLESAGKSLGLGYLPEIDLRVFEHDKAVTELRFALEGGGAAWKSERELRRDRPGARVPDAIATLRGMTIALEFENAEKGAERYRAIFLDHLDHPSAEHVLYVLRAPERLKALPPLLESLTGRRLGLDLGRISFALERDVLAQRLSVRILNLIHGERRLSELPDQAKREG